MPCHLLLPLLLVLPSLLSLAHAATLELRVTDREGKPAADVVVLVEVATARPAALSAESAPRRAPQEVATILQQGSRFMPALTVVHVGSSVRFVNHDAYEHHVRSVPSGPLGATPAAQNLELRQGPSGPRRKPDSPPALNEERFGTPGPVGLGCHLHSTMRGHIYVAATPWFGKTDDNGLVRIDGIPAGSATLKLWHADQLVEQPSAALNFGASALVQTAKLNFTPPPARRRR